MKVSPPGSARSPGRPAGRRFLLALAGLAVSFFLALYATALRETGRYRLGALTALASLALAGVVAVTAVPFLARRTALRRWTVKWEYSLTRPGLVYLLVIAVIAAAALNTGNNLLFIILASLLAALPVSGLLSAIVLAGLGLELALPERLFAGQPVRARLTLRNRKRLAPSLSLTVTAAPPRPVLPRPIYAAYLPRRSSVIEATEITFPRRGRYCQDGLEVSTRFPFGLLRQSRRLPARHEIIVLPSVHPTEEFYEILPLISGELESYCQGRGHDLYAIRDYQESDPARHVDWKATAKTGALKVREFTREDERRVALVFDRGIPCADETELARFEKAVTFCAGLAWHFYEINAQMQFLCDQFETPMDRAAATLYPALERLAVIEPRLSRPLESGSFLARVAATVPGFRIVFTRQPRGSIPTPLWESSYLLFSDSW